jgi:hypothetical protein
MTNSSKRRGEAAGEASLSKVKVCKIHHADPLGAVTGRPHTLWLDKRDPPSFVFKVPAYVQTALACQSQINEPTSELATRKFEALLRQYGEWVKKARAEQVIVLHLNYQAEIDGVFESSDGFSRSNHTQAHRSVTVGVSYKLAFRVNEQLHERKPLDLREPFLGVNRDDHAAERARCDAHNAQERALDLGGGFKVGNQLNSYTSDVVLPYSEALHAKIDLVVNALNGAAATLKDIAEAKDAAAALLTLGGGVLRLSQEPQSKAQAREGSHA